MTLLLHRLVLALVLEWLYPQEPGRPREGSEAWSLQPSKKVIPMQFKPISHSNTIADRPLQNITSTNKKWLSLSIRLQYRKTTSFSETLTLLRKICLVGHQILYIRPLIGNLILNHRWGETFRSTGAKMLYQENLSGALFSEARGQHSLKDPK